MKMYATASPLKHSFFDADVPDRVSYDTYVRGRADLRARLKEIGEKETVDGLIALARSGVLVGEDVYPLAGVMYPVKDILPYREWDRRKSHKYTMLKEQIELNGITTALIMIFRWHKKKQQLEVFLGEGNHRIAIAKDLGIKMVPLRFVHERWS